MNPLVGIFAIIAFIWTTIINLLHFYLTQTSIERKTIFYRRILPFSHAALFLQLLAALCMICSHYHPELVYMDQLYCVEWFMLSCVFYATAMYCIKIAYLVRLNMVNNPVKVNKCQFTIKLYCIFFVAMCLFVDFVQYITIDGEPLFIDSITNTDINFGLIDKNSYKNGCSTKFQVWNGILACGLMTIDAIFFYRFVQSYLNKIRNLIEIHETKLAQTAKAKQDAKKAKKIATIKTKAKKAQQAQKARLSQISEQEKQDLLLLQASSETVETVETEPAHQTNKHDDNNQTSVNVNKILNENVMDQDVIIDVQDVIDDDESNKCNGDTGSQATDTEATSKVQLVSQHAICSKTGVEKPKLKQHDDNDDGINTNTEPNARQRRHEIKKAWKIHSGMCVFFCQFLYLSCFVLLYL